MNQHHYRQVMKMTIPIILQNLLSTAVSPTDVVMLNYVGQAHIRRLAVENTPESLRFRGWLSEHLSILSAPHLLCPYLCTVLARQLA